MPPLKSHQKAHKPSSSKSKKVSKPKRSSKSLKAKTAVKAKARAKRPAKGRSSKKQLKRAPKPAVILAHPDQTTVYMAPHPIDRQPIPAPFHVHADPKVHPVAPMTQLRTVTRHH